jgi:hypothetical protein
LSGGKGVEASPKPRLQIRYYALRSIHRGELVRGDSANSICSIMKSRTSCEHRRKFVWDCSITHRI